MQKVNFKYQREEKQNPFIGFSSFNHFEGESLFSDKIVRADGGMLETTDYESYPVPSGVEQNGREQGFHPQTTVAYFRVLWKDFEPKQGEYDYKFIQDILDGAKAHGQTVMFRLMPHSTTARDDVPNWLKEIIECPERPLGQRVKESPKDDRFFYFFADAVNALANRFDGNPNLFAVDICLSGAWGEGHGVDEYSPQAIDYLVNAFVKGFKKTKLIGQIARPDYVTKLNAIRPVGWRADGVGKPDILNMFYKKVVPQMPSDAWEKAPVAFESFWWITEWQRQGWDFDMLADWMLSCHVSTFNNKSFPVPYDLKENVQRFLDKMGYHFVIDSVEAEVSTDNINIQLTVDNVGVAPIYNQIPLNFAIITYDDSKNHVTDIDITKWLPGKNTVKVTLPLNGKKPFKLGVGIFNEEHYVCFATDAKKQDKYYILF